MLNILIIIGYKNTYSTKCYGAGEPVIQVIIEKIILEFEQQSGLKTLFELLQDSVIEHLGNA